MFLNCSRIFLHYVARPKLPGVPHHAKAGNINHTLHYVFDDAYAEKECVIIFDADFMPRSAMLLHSVTCIMKQNMTKHNYFIKILKYMCYKFKFIFSSISYQN